MKQFVPSEICLKCNGCCRYKEEGSAWRPKLGAGEQADLADLITAGDVLDAQNYIKTAQVCGGHYCKFLNQGDNTCGIYAKRPFECSLYPFILSQTPDGVKLYVHLSCPYVQDHMAHEEYDAYVAYLKGFFRRGDVREFLLLNKGMFHDYSPYAIELLYLFEISFL
jgi:Fe-S-cluster containining protein